MRKQRDGFVAKAEAGEGWRSLDNRQKSWWDERYRRFP